MAASNALLTSSAICAAADIFLLRATNAPSMHNEASVRSIKANKIHCRPFTSTVRARKFVSVGEENVHMMNSCEYIANSFLMYLTPPTYRVEIWPLFGSQLSDMMALKLRNLAHVFV